MVVIVILVELIILYYHRLSSLSWLLSSFLLAYSRDCRLWLDYYPCRDIVIFLVEIIIANMAKKYLLSSRSWTSCTGARWPSRPLCTTPTWGTSPPSPATSTRRGSRWRSSTKSRNKGYLVMALHWCLPKSEFLKKKKKKSVNYLKSCVQVWPHARGVGQEDWKEHSRHAQVNRLYWNCPLSWSWFNLFLSLISCLCSPPFQF